MNPHLYRLEKEGKVVKDPSSRSPLWKLGSIASQGPVSGKEETRLCDENGEASGTSMDAEILQFLRQQDGWTQTSDVRAFLAGLKKADVTKGDINPCLYRMAKEGQILQDPSSDKPRWKSATGQLKAPHPHPLPAPSCNGISFTASTCSASASAPLRPSVSPPKRAPYTASAAPAAQPAASASEATPAESPGDPPAGCVEPIDEELQLQVVTVQLREHNKLKILLQKKGIQMCNKQGNFGQLIKAAHAAGLIDDTEKSRLQQINMRGNCGKHKPERLQRQPADGPEPASEDESTNGNNS